MYNIKYLLVICHSRGCPLSLKVTYIMSSAHYALVLGNRPFPNLLFYHILFSSLYLRKYANNLVIHSQKNAFTKFKADFSCNFKEFLTLNVTVKTLLKLS